MSCAAGSPPPGGVKWSDRERKWFGWGHCWSGCRRWALLARRECRRLPALPPAANAMRMPATPGPVTPQQNGAARHHDGRERRFHSRRSQLRGEVYRFRAQAGAFLHHRVYLTGKPQEHHVDYTLGIAASSITSPRCPTAASSCCRPPGTCSASSWFHNLDIDDPEEAPRRHRCRSGTRTATAATSARSRRTSTPQKHHYKTAWLDFGINCERCHGPGAEHAAFYATPAPSGKACARRRGADSRSMPRAIRWSARSATPSATFWWATSRPATITTITSCPSWNSASTGRRSRLLGRWPAAALLHRRFRLLAERMFPEGQSHLPRLPRGAAQHRRRQESAAQARVEHVLHPLPPSEGAALTATHTTPRKAPAVPAWNATCRARCTASRRRFAITP